MSKHILLATGGSGGHVFPALHTAQVLRQRGHHVSFAGTLQAYADRIQREGFDVTHLDMQGFVSSRLMRIPSALMKLAGGWRQARQLLDHVQPDVVTGFGGYSSFPFVMAAFVKGIPTLVHEQNVMPGKANRYLGMFANRVAISFPSSERYFNSRKVVHTGCPCLLPSHVDQEAVKKAWGLDLKRKTVLVVGGSQGSRPINQAVVGMVQGWLADQSVQIIHMTGQHDFDEVQNAYADVSVPYHVVPFIDDMVAAYAVSDVVVARAGAGTVCEVAAFGKPAIFIPYPHALNHQMANASVLERLGLCAILRQSLMDKKSLEHMILSLKDDTIVSAQTLDALRRIFLIDAPQRLAQAIVQISR